MQLADLPQFMISGARLLNGVWVLDGQFNHLETVREGRSWLYVSRADSLIGDLEALDRETRQARFNTMDPALPSPWMTDATLPWLDGWWQAFHVSLILDTAHPWEQVTFAARDALQSRMPGYRVLQERMGEPPTPDEEIVPGAWDHEHCMLCNAHIDPGDVAYTDPENNWLCAACYTTFAEPHDLSFVRGNA
jgi:hypothetical protein